jgi:hypothetical protein
MQDTGATAASTTTIGFSLSLSNGGFDAVNLADVTVRYWFTADGNPTSGMTFISYYATHGTTPICSNSGCPPMLGIVGTFSAAPAANLPADSYLELSFAASDGMLGDGLTGDTVAGGVVFHGPNYAYKFTETNDYSYNGTKATTPQQTTTITAYVKGQLVWGCEPGSGGSTNASGSSSGGSSSSGSSSSGGADAGTGGAADASGATGDASGQ